MTPGESRNGAAARSSSAEMKSPATSSATRGFSRRSSAKVSSTGTRRLDSRRWPRTPKRNAPVSIPRRWRQRLGMDTGAFLFGVLGHLRESKRLVPVLETFAELRRENPRVALLVAGDFISAELERAAAPFLDSPGVIRRPYLTEREFWLAASALDACINLRDPAAGETSGIAIRLMGLGKPVLVTDSPAVARFPEDACVRIAPGVAERESLRESLRLVTLANGAAVAIGQRAAKHVHERHRIEQAGTRYWELLCE